MRFWGVMAAAVAGAALARAENCGAAFPAAIQECSAVESGSCDGHAVHGVKDGSCLECVWSEPAEFCELGFFFCLQLVFFLFFFVFFLLLIGWLVGVLFDPRLRLAVTPLPSHPFHTVFHLAAAVNTQS
jgi:hypothetical protein